MLSRPSWPDPDLGHDLGEDPDLPGLARVAAEPTCDGEHSVPRLSPPQASPKSPAPEMLRASPGHPARYLGADCFLPPPILHTWGCDLKVWPCLKPLHGFITGFGTRPPSVPGPSYAMLVFSFTSHWALLRASPPYRLHLRELSPEPSRVSGVTYGFIGPPLNTGLHTQDLKLFLQPRVYIADSSPTSLSQASFLGFSRDITSLCIS